MSTAPLDEPIIARARLRHVAAALYSDPAAALEAMRRAAHIHGADAVRRQLEADFSRFGKVNARVQGPVREQVQEVLREGAAADIGGWLAVDHGAAHRGGNTGIEDRQRDWSAASAGPAPDPRAGLNPEERVAFDHLEAYAEARERAHQRSAAEAQLHGINDHRANLDAAKESVPRARNTLRKEVRDTFAEGEKAFEQICAAIERDGAGETARRIRSREFLKGKEKPVSSAANRFGIFSRRDRAAEAEARERVAKRIETVGYYEDRVTEWSTYQPQDGSRVNGEKNVRAALDRDEARIRAASGIDPDRGQPDRSRAEPGATRHPSERGSRPGSGSPGRRPGTGPAPHPSREASDRGRAALQSLDRLPPPSRERVARAVQQAGMDKLGAALNHLQTLQSIARTFREGIEVPGH